MAVEIKEVIIRAVLEDDAHEQEPGAEPSAGTDAGPADNAELIEACVEQVLRILKRKQQR